MASLVKYSFFIISGLIGSISYADFKSDLMLMEGKSLISAEKLAKTEELAYSIDRNSRFCFIGSVDAVAAKINKWNQDGQFFSGGGGGYELISLSVTKHGIVGPKISLIIRSEVTGEIENPIYVLKCRPYD